MGPECVVMMLCVVRASSVNTISTFTPVSGLTHHAVDKATYDDASLYHNHLCSVSNGLNEINSTSDHHAIVAKSPKAPRKSSVLPVVASKRAVLIMSPIRVIMILPIVCVPFISWFVDPNTCLVLYILSCVTQLTGKLKVLRRCSGFTYIYIYMGVSHLF